MKNRWLLWALVPIAAAASPTLYSVAVSTIQTEVEATSPVSVVDKPPLVEKIDNHEPKIFVPTTSDAPIEVIKPPDVPAVKLDPPPPPVTKLACVTYKPVVDLNIQEYDLIKADVRFATSVKKAPESGPNPFLRYVTSQIDNAFEKKDEHAAACAVDALLSWASSNALLGKMNTLQSQYDRLRISAGLSVAYYKLQKMKAVDDVNAKLIELWLYDLTKANKNFVFNIHKKTDAYYYWLGLQTAAFARASNNALLMHDASQILDKALSSIGSDGTLPLEVVKNERALFYHTLALSALVPMIEFVAGGDAKESQKLYDSHKGAMHKLVMGTVMGLILPDLFSKAVNHKQLVGRNGFGWFTLYDDRYNGRLPLDVPEVPASHPWIGGSVETLIKVMEQ